MPRGWWHGHLVPPAWAAGGWEAVVPCWDGGDSGGDSSVPKPGCPCPTRSQVGGPGAAWSQPLPQHRQTSRVFCV